MTVLLVLLIHGIEKSVGATMTVLLVLLIINRTSKTVIVAPTDLSLPLWVGHIKLWF
jgi:hypothetical protein